MAGERSINYVSTDSNYNDADQSVDALIIGAKWANTATTALTYSFVNSQSDYSYNPFGNFYGAFSTTQQTATRDALAEFSAVAKLTFSEQAFGSENATLRFAEFSGISTAYGYYPNSNELGGDMAFNFANYNTPTLGCHAYATFIHEIGHAMGLKHGHENTGRGDMLAHQDSMEYSIMTYDSFVGQNSNPGFYTNKSGHFAQSLMMYDIAAIQRLYGADFSTNNGNSVYTFNSSSGAMSINGANQGTPGGNIIFRTVWDGGGEDTYDLSNYTTNLHIDLDPGDYSNFNVGGNAQRAKLNAGFNSAGNYVGASEAEYARGHVFNALQYNGNTSSLIENAIGGSGHDLLDGNAAANKLYGGAGNDRLYGGAGRDYLYGGTNNDILDVGAGTTTAWQYAYGGTQDDIYYGGSSTGLLFIGGTAENASSGNSDWMIFTDLNFSDFTFGRYDYGAGNVNGNSLRMYYTHKWPNGSVRLCQYGIRH